MIDTTWGNTGRTLVFAPGNGFSAAAYQHLLAPLAETYQVHGLKLRPLWDRAEPTRDWHDLGRDIGEFVDRHFDSPIVGIGHSIGAVSLLLSAADRPQRYAQIVLLDPVTMPAWASLVLRYAPDSVRRRGPLAMRALKRSDRFESVDEAYAGERKRRSFVRVSDAVLRHIVQSGLIAHPEGGYTLRFSKQWESLLYQSPANVWPALRRNLPPVTVVRGAESDLLSATAFTRWKALCPDHRFVELPGCGHLVPFEKPQMVAELVMSEIENQAR